MNFRNSKHIFWALVALLVFISWWRFEMRNEPEIYSEHSNHKFTGIPDSLNFKLDEFNCNDGTAVPSDYYGNVQRLMDNLQVLHDFYKVPIFINSGYRHDDYNKKIGGKPKSMHLVAGAADIVVLGVPAKKVQSDIRKLINQGKMAPGGLGCYSSFTHYDIGKNRTWNG